MTIREALHIFTHQGDYDQLTIAVAIDTLGAAGLLED